MKEIKKVVIETIKHEDQRYSTLGDWTFDEEGTLQIKVSDIGNWKAQIALAMHELYEAILCTARSITPEMVDDFDNLFEEEIKQGLHGDDGEPGEDPRAPYYNEHYAAEAMDTQLRHELGVTRKEWNDDFFALFDREIVLENLEKTYIRIQPSFMPDGSSRGVGVFAIRDIPKGTSVFKIIAEDKNGNLPGWYILKKEDFDTLSPEVKEMVETFCTKKDGVFSVPKEGFWIMDLVNYLNDSEGKEDANIESVDDGVMFLTKRDVKKGEELLINYEEITE